MSEIITLSSDEETETLEPPKKIAKLDVQKPLDVDNNLIVLSDDDCVENNEKSQNGSINLDETYTECSVNCNGSELKEDLIANKQSEPITDNSLEDCSVPSTSNGPNTALEQCSKLDEFFNRCLSAVENKDHKSLLISKIPCMKKLYFKCLNNNLDNMVAKDIVDDYSKKLNEDPIKVLIYFNSFYQELKNCYKLSTVDSSNNLKIIKKLDKALVKVRRKIRYLEEIDSNLEDEENSTYIQLMRYKERAVQIYAKLCKYTNNDPHYGHNLHRRLDFSHSNYPEINRCINKKYKNNSCFPNYYDMHNCILKAVEAKGLMIPKKELEAEVRSCFKVLGEQLQKRRMLDLMDVHTDYVPNFMEDPAANDPELEAQLKANQNEGHKKLKDIFHRYTMLQEKGVNPEVSSDSDDSDHPDSESELAEETKH